METLPILVVEDDHDLLEAICTTMKIAGYSTYAATDGNAALSLLQDNPVGMIVSDVQMQPMNGFDLLQRIREFYPHIPVLLMTAHGEVKKAVQAMRNGACDYLLKPFDPDSLLVHVKRYVLPASKQHSGVIAEDPRTHELLSLANRVSQSSATVMLSGESGSGKEVIAQYIHLHSPRSSGPFVAINCAAIPDNLLEAT